MSTQKNGSKDEQEPSMEEILSSIKRIIADDEDPNSSAESAKESKMNGGNEDEDVLELTEIVPDDKKNGKATANGTDGNLSPSAAGSEQSAKSQSGPSDDAALEDEIAFEADFEDEDPKSEPDQHLNDKETPVMDATANDALLSNDTANASTKAFSKLTKAVQGRGDEANPSSNGTTIEAFVAELLRPSLKEWLDGNLERIVENVVEQEVKKLARRAELL